MTEKAYKAVSSRKTGLQRLRATIGGPPGSGKSTVAGTVSKDWEKASKAKGWAKLTDMLWWPFDEGATTPFLNHKVDVAEVPWTEMLNDTDHIIQAVDAGLDWIFDNYPKGGHMVVDTVSTLDDAILSHFNDPRYCPTTGSGGRDSFALERYVTAVHQLIKTELCKLDCSVWFLIHYKTKSSAAGGALQTMVQSTPGTGNYVPGLYYNNSRNVYRRHTDMMLYAARIIARGEDKYILMSDPSAPELNGAEVKCRLRSYIKPTEEPDLGKILRRIEKEIQ